MMSESNGGSAYTVSYHPRLCHLTKWDDFNGYGFNLHAEKGKAGQYIGKVDEGSPAIAAKLRQGDRIVEVNGVNIGNENHQQVVQRIKAGGEETRLLVVDAETDLYFKEKKIVVRGDMPEVIYCKTPLTSDCIDTEGPVHVNTHQTEQETGETTQEIIKPAEVTPDVVGEASVLVNGVKEEEIAAPEQVEVKENGVSECDSIEEAGSKADILVSQIEVTNPEPEVEVPEVSALEPEVAIPEPEVSVPEPVIATSEPEVSVPEPEVSVPEPEVSVPEPEVAVPEPEVAVPEPVVAVPEPVVAVPEPVVATSEPEVSVPEPVVSVPEPEVSIPVSTPPEAEPVPEPAELKPEPVVEPPQAEATPSPIPVSPVETKGTDLLDFGNVSVEEMKKRIQSKKKIDTRFSQMGLREKYDLLQRL